MNFLTWPLFGAFCKARFFHDALLLAHGIHESFDHVNRRTKELIAKVAEDLKEHRQGVLADLQFSLQHFEPEMNGLSE